jgi:hypothetical protein
MNTVNFELSKISKQELKNIKDKMYFFNISDGYIGKVKGSVVLFLQPCNKASQHIQLKEVEEALDKHTCNDK